MARESHWQGLVGARGTRSKVMKFDPLKWSKNVESQLNTEDVAFGFAWMRTSKVGLGIYY